MSRMAFDKLRLSGFYCFGYSQRPLMLSLSKHARNFGLAV